MKKVAFPRKLFTCVITGLNGMYAVHELGRLAFEAHIDMVSVIAFSTFFLCLAAVPLWHYQEKKQKPGLFSTIGFWQWAVAYFVAVDLCMFAWRKIFHLQFYAPQGLLDKTVSSLSGQQLLIAFFAYSYPLAVILAVFQLAGSVLLLSKRLRLLGIFVLLPVVANIILFDIFYDIEVGALIQAFVITGGLFFLLAPEFGRIKDFFLHINVAKTSGSAKKWLGHAVQISAVVLPFGLCAMIYDFPNRHPELTGKYEVQELVVNHEKHERKSCSDTILTLVYIDDNNDLVFENNHPDNWQVGHFKYDKHTKKMEVIWRFPKNFHDTLRATISKTDRKNKIKMHGIMGKDTIVATLNKL